MKRHWLAIVTLLVIAALWGATFSLIKDVLTRIAPEPFIAWRFTIAGLVLIAAAAQRRALSRPLLRPGIILGVLVFAGYWMQTRGLLFISPSRSAFVTGLYVVMVPFTDAIVYRTRIPLRAWTSSVVAVIGFAAMAGGFDARPTWGDFLTFGCAVLFAFHVVFSARFSAEHSPVGLAAVQVLFVGLAAIPPAAFAPRPAMSTGVVAVILFTAIVTTALAFAALMWGQAHVTATEAAVILSFEPVAASITSIGWYGEPVTASFVIGAALILAAMTLSQLGASATMPD
ncbi:MAG TPA: DMT family transporter [Thermoanaerobaculia bacterium]|nr:DMT family transporter [Thermoanaerobaculia bacterium]